MANTVNLRTVIDGPKKVIIHGYLASDGSSGDLSDQVVIDVSGLTPVPTRVSILSIQAHFSGFSGIFEFDASTDVAFASVPADDQVFIDFTDFGGLKDNAGSGFTGDILLTTSGFTASGDRGYFVIIAEKD